MTDQFFTNRATLQRLHLGPLGPHIDGFATFLSAQGYAKSSARLKIQVVGILSQWLHRRKLRIDALNDHVADRFLQQLRLKRPSSTSAGDGATIRMLLRYLREADAIPTPTPEIDNSDLHHVEHSFVQYLTQERGLSQVTCTNYFSLVRQFLTERFGTGPILFEGLCPMDITRFVLRHVHILTPRRAQLMTTALRSFLRFLHVRGDIATNLARVVPTVPNWRHAALPKFIPPDQVEHLLQSCDQSTTSGQRDYTILLLLARLGLRAKEVGTMTLDDIDWEAGELTVRRKGSRQDRLPLPQEVGNALATYLCRGRARCSTRRVFVRAKAPYQGFASSVAICNVVERALLRAGLSPANKGAHLLRYSLATRMLGKGASLTEIGEILGHTALNTTQIYAKVDLANLRTLALPWPGGGA